MKLRHLFAANAVICFIYGGAFAVAPALLLSLYGPTPNPLGLLVARLFGALLLGMGLINLKLMPLEQSEAARAVTLSLALADALGCAFFIQATLAGDVNALGWSVVAIYGLVAAAFGAFTAMGKPAALSSP